MGALPMDIPILCPTSQVELSLYLRAVLQSSELSNIKPGVIHTNLLPGRATSAQCQ